MPRRPPPAHRASLEALAQRRRLGAYLMGGAALLLARAAGAVTFPAGPAAVLVTSGAVSAVCLALLHRGRVLRLAGGGAAALWVPVDLAVEAGLVAISGGADSPLRVFYAGTVLAAAAVGGAVTGWAAAALAVALDAAATAAASPGDVSVGVARTLLVLVAVAPPGRAILELRRKRRAALALRRSDRERAQELEALSAELEARNRELDRLNRELERAAVTDSLTGLPNRRQMPEAVRVAMARVRRARRAGDANHDLGFLMVDLDRFKRINDLFGHEAGDAVLRETARRIRRAVRGADTVVRWGGEEFLVIAPELDRKRLGDLAERIREAVAATAAQTGRGGAVPTTCSVGYAAWPLDAAARLGWEDAVALADAALLMAKAEGRNRSAGLDLARPDLPVVEAERALRDPPGALAAGILRRLDPGNGGKR